MTISFLAEEEWIEEQLATNPDFDPNEDATGVNSGVDEQHASVGHDSAADQTARSTGQNGTSDSAIPPADGEHPDGENATPEARPKPKRYVS